MTVQKLITPLIQMVVASGFVFAAPLAQAQSLSERLGYAPDEKILILHADDIGIIDSSNTAAVELYKAGLVKSGSIMTQGPAADEAFRSTAQAFNGDLGIHLSLTGEGGWKPAAGVANVPSLVDTNGSLFDNPLKLVFWAKKGDIFREIKAQIERALNAGFTPSHIDTHLGEVFFKPSWFDAYLNLAKAYRLPPMVPRWNDEIKALFGPAAKALDWVIQPMLEKVEKAGFLQIDYLYIYPFPSTDEGYDARKQKYVNLLKNMKPGVSEILFHPASDSEEFRRFKAERPDEAVRLHEAEIFRDPEIRALIESQKIHLIGWKEIKAIYPWDNVKFVEK